MLVLCGFSDLLVCCFTLFSGCLLTFGLVVAICFDLLRFVLDSWFELFVFNSVDCISFSLNWLLKVVIYVLDLFVVCLDGFEFGCWLFDIGFGECDGVWWLFTFRCVGFMFVFDVFMFVV